MEDDEGEEGNVGSDDVEAPPGNVLLGGNDAAAAVSDSAGP